MQYSLGDTENRVVFPPLPPIFNGILSREAQPRVTKYRLNIGQFQRYFLQDLELILRHSVVLLVDGGEVQVRVEIL